MNLSAENMKEKEIADLIKFMEQNGITYNINECCGCNRICLNLGKEENGSQKHCYNSAIAVQTYHKDVCRIHPYEILYIANKNRKSVLYLADREIEVNFRFDYWVNVLDNKIFVKPHNSFIVNLNYVEEVTRDGVRVKCGDKEYRVYTSSRKAGAFRKAFIDFVNDGR